MSQLVHIVRYDIAIKNVSPFHYIYVECLCIYYILCILYVIYTHTTFMCVFWYQGRTLFIKMWSKDRLGTQEMDQQLRVLASLQEDLSSVASTYIWWLNQLQFQGIQCPLLPLVDTQTHTAYTYTDDHTHKHACTHTHTTYVVKNWCFENGDSWVCANSQES